MAYAEAGQFGRALELQRQLVEQLESAAGSERAARQRRQLAAYEDGRPWRADSPEEILMVLAQTVSG